jgi:hypothetical protein
VKSENFTLLAIAAEKFGCRPSSLVLLADPVLALDFDLAAAARLLEIARGAVEPSPLVADSPGSQAGSHDMYW